MNIKKQIPRLISALLSFSIVLGNVIPAYATESITVEKPVNDESNWVTDEGNFEEIEVTYKQASSFFVTIPKTIVLDGWKQAAYSVKVSGDIGAEQCVYVAPIDGIAGTDNIDFYMKDQASENKKEDVLATVTQKKMHWNSAEAAKGYEQTDNLVSALDLTAGTWKGIFQMEIKLEAHSSHTHNYIESITKNPTCTEAGEKTYICDCGDSYTETIPATGHHYVDDECEHCGEKDPDAHTHSYTETITKEPTCTEEGEKTYTCECGDSYTEVIPATGHHYGDDDKCTDCGELNPEHKHNYTETITKEPTCTEDGEKTYTCDCGDSYTEVIPATGHNYVDGTCEHCGEKNDPHASNRIKIGTTETRVIAGQELEFICIDDAYVDATGKEKGALFIAKDFISGNELSMGIQYSYQSVVEWGSINNNVRKKLNGETSDKSDLVFVNTTVTKRYLGDKTTKNYDMETIDSYGSSNQLNAVDTTDQVFILSLEEAIKYNKVMIDGKEITAMWDLDCDGEIDMTSSSNYRYGYQLRTHANEGVYVIAYDGCVRGNKYNSYGIRPCYVKQSGYHEDVDGDDICDLCGHQHIWEENLDTLEWAKNFNDSKIVNTGNQWKMYYNSSSNYTANGYWTITVPEDVEYSFDYQLSGSGSNYLNIYLDEEIIVQESKNISASKTVTLTKGTHIIRAYFSKQNSWLSPYATITLNPIEKLNHICTECSERQNHNYTESIIKEPTCTESGEKKLICTKCGYSYTEEVPSNGGPHIDENNDDICDRCGHKHIWEDNIDTLEWTKNFNSSSIVKTGNQWKLYYDTSNQYTKYTLDGYWDITVPEDVEYSFDYCLSDWGSDSLAIYLDDTEIVNVSEDSTNSKIVTLTKGTHTIHAHFNKQSEWTGPYATITLNPIIVLNHVCTECGEKEAHHYAEGIVIKEPTCTEKGEKEFTCTKCNGTKTEEIDALGHNYVDGVCDRCGSLNLVKKRFWSAISSTSETEDTGGGHYDMATLSGAYSPNIEITEDMKDGEYLLLDFYVKYPFYGGQGHYGEADGINGLSMLQKYNEETDTWETVYSYGLSYSTVGTNMAAQEGGYTFSPGNGIRRSFQLEKGTYRAYGRFSAGSGCGSSVAHHYYTYFISVDLCKVEKEAAETP